MFEDQSKISTEELIRQRYKGANEALQAIHSGLRQMMDTYMLADDSVSADLYVEYRPDPFSIEVTIGEKTYILKDVEEYLP